MDEKQLHKYHRQRMKEKFLKNGLDSFSDHEVLEFLLYFSIAQHNTNETAHLLMNRYGSLSSVLEAKYSDLIKQPGIGPHSAVLFNLIPQLSQRYTKDKLYNKRTFQNIDTLCEFLINHFLGSTEERVDIFLFDTSMKLITHKTLQTGELTQTNLNINAIANYLYAYDAANFILAHNHPTGNTDASDNDLQITRRLLTTFEPLDKHLVDHIIIAGGEYNRLLEKVLI